MAKMDMDLIQEAILHAESVLDHQPGIDFDSVMFHVESNYPELTHGEEEEVRYTVRDRHYPDVVPGCYRMEFRGAAHVIIPLNNEIAA